MPELSTLGAEVRDALQALVGAAQLDADKVKGAYNTPEEVLAAIVSATTEQRSAFVDLLEAELSFPAGAYSTPAELVTALQSLSGTARLDFSAIDGGLTVTDALDARLDTAETTLVSLDSRLDTVEGQVSATPTFTSVNIGNADTTLTRVSAGVVAIEGSNVVTASTAPAAVLSAVGTLAASGTDGPTLGAAVADAIAAQTTANVRASLDKINREGELMGLAMPYVGGARPTPTEGAILLVGPAIDDDLRAAVAADMTGVDQEPNSFFVTDAASLAVYKTHAEAAAIINAAQSATVTRALSSNTLQFNLDEDGHKIRTSAPTGNVTIAAACWDAITDAHAPVRVGIPFGGTGYTVSVATPADGLVTVEMPTTAFTANRTAFFDLSRFDGVPMIRYLGESAAAVAALPAFVAYAVAGAGATAVTPPAHQANDLLVAVAVAPGSASLPTLASGWTDSGLATDGNAPSVRIAWKVAAGSSETCTGWTSATQVGCFVFRKAGSTPSFHSTVVRTDANFADTSVSFPALNPAVSSIFVAVSSARGADTLTLPGGMTALTSSYSGGATANETRVGYSTVATSWSAANGTKTGAVGRAEAIIFAVK
jgi:hypothetical protein